MKQNAGQTKQHQNANVIEAIASAMPRNAGGDSVHIADGGVDTEGKKANVFIASLPLNTLPHGTNVPGEYSSVGRASRSHREGFTGSSPVTPTIRHKFKSTGDKGFLEWFWSQVDVSTPDQCWPWKRSLNGDGYGQIAVGGKNWTASRLAYVLSYGGIGKGLLVCHSCDNKPCCNPSHLYAGTKSQNERDKHQRTAPKTLKGTANHFSKLHNDDILDIRVMIKNGETNAFIGKVMGVHHSTISAIRKGKTWKHV